MKQYYGFLPVPLIEHPAVVWVGDQGTGVETPEGLIMPDEGVFRVNADRPCAITIWNNPSFAEPEPITSYIVYTNDCQFFATLADPDPITNPQPDSGIVLPSPTLGVYTVPCARPVQFILLDPPLVNCSPIGTSPTPPPPPPGPNAIADYTNGTWNLWFSPNMPGQVNWGNGYPLPTVNGLHYIVYPDTNLSAVNAIHVIFEITGNDSVQHVDLNDIQPCKIVLFFGIPDTTFAHLRFWSDQNFTMTPGVHEMTIPLDPNHWHTVDGSHDAAAFASMKNQTANTGWTCGGQFFDGHGVLSRDGSNGIILRKYELLG